MTIKQFHKKLRSLAGKSRYISVKVEMDNNGDIEYSGYSQDASWHHSDSPEKVLDHFIEVIGNAKYDTEQDIEISFDLAKPGGDSSQYVKFHNGMFVPVDFKTENDCEIERNLASADGILPTPENLIKVDHDFEDDLPW